MHIEHRLTRTDLRHSLQEDILGGAPKEFPQEAAPECLSDLCYCELIFTAILNRYPY